MRIRTLVGLWMVLLSCRPALDAAESSSAVTWNCGYAEAKITPKQLLWLGGFASRKRPAEGTLDELWARALAFEAPGGELGVLVTADLLGIPKPLYDRLCGALHRAHGLTRAQIRFATSHTHSGPVLADAMYDMYPLDEQQRRWIADYSRELEQTLLDVVARALASRQPAQLWAAEGRATFAFNRQTNKESDLPDMVRKGIQPNGPTDVAVPVLAVRSPEGALRCVLFGYAAHTSALTDNFRWSADYAGAARRALESRRPGVSTLYFQGCGSDQSAVPRGSVERCQALGEQLAKAVDAVLDQPMRPVPPRFRAAFEFIPLDYGDPPTRAELEPLANGKDYRAPWARGILAKLDAGKLDRGYPEYPVQVWNFGTNQLWIGLGGEVCIDYALRFRREFGPATWVCGYVNDDMAYIPSRRLWEAGGYQTGAFEVYGLPAVRWCPDIEERIARSVQRLVQRVR